MSSTHPIRILSRQDIETLLPMSKAIALMKSAFKQLSSDQTIVPIRTHLHLPKEDGEVLFMPVYLEEQAQTGLKMVNMNHQNPKLGLPLIQAMMIVSDARTGRPLGLMDAGSITAIRTGAASGLATQLLAREDANTLAIFGTGGQAKRQIEAVIAVRDISKIWVYGRNEEKGLRFSKEIQAKWNISCEWTNSLGELKTADIICTATTSSTPLFDLTHLKSAVHINGIGAYRPDMAEVPSAVIGKARVYVDQHEACMKEAGDIIQAITHGDLKTGDIIGELGELIIEKIQGRIREDDITFFKSVGNAAQDLVCASYALKEARERKIGHQVLI